MNIERQGRAIVFKDDVGKVLTKIILKNHIVALAKFRALTGGVCLENPWEELMEAMDSHNYSDKGADIAHEYLVINDDENYYFTLPTLQDVKSWAECALQEGASITGYEVVDRENNTFILQFEKLSVSLTSDV